MRNLTIKRHKSFVGCLAKMKVYIEDETAGEIKINDVPCRKIGDIKNGEEKTFQVSDESSKVFMIADKISRNYCNEFYQLPAGENDIFLSGKNEFNPASGNAFRFDNNENEEIIANRKKGTKKGLIILIVSVIIGALIGYFMGFNFLKSTFEKDKTFSNEGMTITLTSDFRKSDIQNYTVVYDSRDVAVFALKEEFSLVEGFENYTLEEYAKLVLEANGLENTKLSQDANTISFIYNRVNPNTNDTYSYFNYVYKTDDAFWLVQFATLKENVDKQSQNISNWAKSIQFVK